MIMFMKGWNINTTSFFINTINVLNAHDMQPPRMARPVGRQTNAAPAGWSWPGHQKFPDEPLAPALAPGWGQSNSH